MECIDAQFDCDCPPILDAAHRYTAERPSLTDESPLPVHASQSETAEFGASVRADEQSELLTLGLSASVAHAPNRCPPTFCMALPQSDGLVCVQLLVKLLARRLEALIALPRDLHIPAVCCHMRWKGFNSPRYRCRTRQPQGKSEVARAPP